MKTKINKFSQYLKVTKLINTRFPFATQEELDNATNICPICYDSMDISNAKKLDCNHIFHLRCIKKWMQNKADCPVCRAPLTRIDHIHNPNGNNTNNNNNNRNENQNNNNNNRRGIFQIGNGLLPGFSFSYEVAYGGNQNVDREFNNLNTFNTQNNRNPDTGTNNTNTTSNEEPVPSPTTRGTNLRRRTTYSANEDDTHTNDDNTSGSSNANSNTFVSSIDDNLVLEEEEQTNTNENTGNNTDEVLIEEVPFVANIERENQHEIDETDEL